MSGDFTETRKSSKLVYAGRMLEVREDEVLLPDGNEARREYVVHPGAALILPLFDDDHVLLERQYRYPVGQHLYELPAGKFERDESSLETAKRELLEETGYVAKEWTSVCTMLPCIPIPADVARRRLVEDLCFHVLSREFLSHLHLKAKTIRRT